VIEAYRRARKQALREAGKDKAAGRPLMPAALDELMAGHPFAREQALGRMEVPLSLVAGTVTRARQLLFSRRFLPLAGEDSEFAAKWSALMDAQLAEGFRDPIVAYECLQRFYVQEGNKRVSVARYLGAPTIAAEVTRVVPPPGIGLDAELARYEGFLRFYAVAPLYAMDLSYADDYTHLARLLGRDLEEPWPPELVRKLQAALALFTAAVGKRAGAGPGRPACDAFLVYLQLYADDDPLGASAAQMDERVKASLYDLRGAARADEGAFAEGKVELGQGRITRAVAKVAQATDTGQRYLAGALADPAEAVGAAVSDGAHAVAAAAAGAASAVVAAVGKRAPEEQ